MEAFEYVGSLWEYGALIVILAIAVWKLWGRNNYLEDELIQLSKDYSEAVTELNDLIKGETRGDKRNHDKNLN